MQPHGLIMSYSRSSSSLHPKLCTRLCTLLTTALKVGRCAIATTAPNYQKSVSWQAMENAIMITGFARCWFFAALDTINSMGDSQTVVPHCIMSIGLMFRALHAVYCATTSCAAVLESRPAPAAEAAMEQSSPETNINCKASGITLHKVMTGLEQAVVNADCILHSLSRPDPALTQHQTISYSSVIEDLQLLAKRELLPQITHITVHLMPWRRSVGCSAPVDAPAISAQQSQVEEKSKERIDVPSSAWIGEASVAGSEGERYPCVSHLSSAVCDIADAILRCIPWAFVCNNSGCTNLTKLSDWQLVCGKACICAGCEAARYCSKSCQQQDWKLHKALCTQSHRECAQS